MTEVVEEFVTIDLRLRFVFFGLECVLGVMLSPSESERVFRQAIEDQVSAKAYTFHDSPRLQVTGQVGEFEPETIQIKVEGKRGVGEVLRRVIDGAESHVFRLRSTQEPDS